MHRGGGLIIFRPPLQQGSLVKLMFLAKTGAVLGSAQMLTPVAWNQQPFRFVALHDDDQMRLNAAIQFSLEHHQRREKERNRGRERVAREPGREGPLKTETPTVYSGRSGFKRSASRHAGLGA